MLFRLLHSDIKVNNYICSDINSDLISLWNTIKDNPYELIKSYNIKWNELNKDDDIDRRKEYFYSVRKHFNETRDVSSFLFLSRTCTNGLIRYNSKGEFNTSLHFSRDGIIPETLNSIIIDWSEKLNEHSVQFICRDYSEIKSGKNDVLYLDPPYANTKGIYFGKIDYEKMWNWMREQEGAYYLSFDGKRDEIDNTYNVPSDLFRSHEYLVSGRSSFKDLKDQETQIVKESLYIK